MAAVCARIPTRRNVQFDWDEPSKVIRVEIDQNKARVLGISSQDLATFLNNSLSGFSVTYFRERDKQVEVLLRGAAEERAKISFLKDLAIPSRNGRAVPITQIADIRYEQEDGIIWRRDRLPTITVRADVKGDAQGPTSPTGSTRSSTRSARRCRWATGSSWAARSRIRRAASSRSPPACRCFCCPCSRC